MPKYNASKSRRELLKATGVIGLATAGVTSANFLPDNEESEQKSIYITGDEDTTEEMKVKQQKLWGQGLDDWWRLDSSIECFGGNTTEHPKWDWVNHFRLFTGAEKRRYDPETEDPSDGEK